MAYVNMASPFFYHLEWPTGRGPKSHTLEQSVNAIYLGPQHQPGRYHPSTELSQQLPYLIETATLCLSISYQRRGVKARNTLSSKLKGGLAELGSQGRGRFAYPRLELNTCHTWNLGCLPFIASPMGLVQL